MLKGSHCVNIRFASAYDFSVKLGSVWHFEDCFTYKIIISLENKSHGKLSDSLICMLLARKNLFLWSNRHQSSVIQMESKIEKSTDYPHWKYGSCEFLRKSKILYSSPIQFTRTDTDQIITCAFLFKLENTLIVF